MSRFPSLRLYRVPASLAAELLRDESSVYRLVTSDAPFVGLGDGWPALHVILSGGDPPTPRHVALERGLSWNDRTKQNVLMGGDATPFNDGFSRARVVSPETVKVLAPKLSAESDDARVTDYEMDYAPEGWDKDQLRAVLRAEVPRVFAIYRDAAAAGDAILICASSATPPPAARKALTKVGFFKELKHGRPDGGSLASERQASAGPDEARIAAYLRGGAVLAVSPGPVRDVLTNDIIGSLEIRTDGAYAWPSDLAHYVEKHHVRLPEAFLAHIRTNAFTVPQNVDTRSLTL